DIAGTMTAIDHLADSFLIDGAGMKLTALTRASKSATTAAANKTLAESGLAAVGDALAGDDYETALSLLALAGTAAPKGKLGPLLTRAQASGAEARDAQKEYELVRAAARTLQQKPDDPDANLATGKYLCFRKGEWARGLPCLAAGSDAALQALAKKDLTK